MLWHSTILVIPYTGFTFLFSTFILPLVSIKNIKSLAHCFTFICNYFPLNAEKNRKEKKWNEKRRENLLRLLLLLLSRPLSRSGAGINNFSDSTRLSWLGHGAPRDSKRTERAATGFNSITAGLTLFSCRCWNFYYAAITFRPFPTYLVFTLSPPLLSLHHTIPTPPFRLYSQLKFH